MKIKIAGLLIFLTIFSACTNETDDTSTSEPTSDANYFPLSAGNYWNYDNRSEPADQPPMESTDQLIVAGSTGNSYNMSAEMPAEGFMTNLLDNGTLTKQDYKLIFTGVYEFSMEGFGSLTLPLNNAVMYDASAISGAELFSVTDEISQTMGEIPLQISYTVTTTQEGFLDSFEVNGTTYEDVITSSFTLNLAIFTSVEVFGTSVNIPILGAQDVFVGQNYYAADVGMIYSDVIFHYDLEDLSQYPINIPMPETATVESTQSLTTHTAVQD